MLFCTLRTQVDYSKLSTSGQSQLNKISYLSFFLNLYNTNKIPFIGCNFLIDHKDKISSSPVVYSFHNYLIIEPMNNFLHKTNFLHI